VQLTFTLSNEQIEKIVASVATQQPVVPVVEPPVEPPVIVPVKQDLTGSVPWLHTFGSEFGSRKSHIKRVYVPVEGLSIAFTIPDDREVGVQLGTIEYAGNVGTIVHSISRVVGNFGANASEISQGAGGGLIGGIRYTGTGVKPVINYVPGRTYFWNLKWTSNLGQYRYLQYVYRQF